MGFSNFYSDMTQNFKLKHDLKVYYKKKILLKVLKIPHER